MKRVKLMGSDTDAMVDRRIVVKLLTTFFERKQSPEILQLMTRMLGFTGMRGRLLACCVNTLLCIIRLTASASASASDCMLCARLVCLGALCSLCRHSLSCMCQSCKDMPKPRATSEVCPCS